MALPYIPLFVADYLADAGHLTMAEHGVYLNLIMVYWQRGGALPADDDRLARLIRATPDEWAACKEAVSKFFIAGKSEWRHRRIDLELKNVADKSAKSTNAAKLRWQKEPHANAHANAHAPAMRTQCHTDTDTDTDTNSLPLPTRKQCRKPTEKVATFVAPDWIDPETWKDFQQHRIEIKKKLTPTATKGLIAKLDKHRKTADPNAVLRESIAQGWQGVFPEKLTNGATHGNPRPESRKERFDRTIADELAAIADRHGGTLPPKT